MNKRTALQILLGLVGLAHLGLGLLANLAPPETLARLVSAFYGAALDVAPQVHHVTRIVGAFMIGIAVMAFLACRDPQRNRVVIWGIITILVLRVIQRVTLAQEISSAFNIAPSRIWMQVAFFLATAVALFLLLPKSTDEVHQPVSR
jgi:hypothetical protein